MTEIPVLGVSIDVHVNSVLVKSSPADYIFDKVMVDRAVAAIEPGNSKFLVNT
jgi:hypothetical protein